jgi:hypothetical protein
MSTFRRPIHARSLFLAALLACWPSSARAGAFPFWGLSYGSPERWAGHVGLSFGDDVPGSGIEGFAFGTGTVLETTVGVGAGSFGIGKSLVLLTEEKHLRAVADLKGIVTRTWNEPRAASADSTYLGVEGGLSVTFVRFTLGVTKRIEERTRGDEWMYHWGVGIQIRIGGKKKNP